jgi:hypothetical protein
MDAFYTSAVQTKDPSLSFQDPQYGGQPARFQPVFNVEA